MQADLVFVDELVPGVRWDAKYATWDNFTDSSASRPAVERTGDLRRFSGRTPTLSTTGSGVFG